MNRAALTEKIRGINREKGWTWKYIHQQIGGYSPVLLVGALLGQMKLTKPQAAKAADLSALSKAETALLNEVPMRGAGVAMPPTDPLIYRFYELVMVNGPAWKALIDARRLARLGPGSCRPAWRRCRGDCCRIITGRNPEHQRGHIRIPSDKSRGLLARLECSNGLSGLLLFLDEVFVLFLEFF